MNIEPWILSFSGRVINPLALTADDLTIGDLAHALACLNRFCGHTRRPISVAQHSVYVSCLVPPAHALQGLLHDGSEAVIGEVTKWLKASPAMAGYREAEAAAQRVIYARFGCALVDAPEVEEADIFMARVEGAYGYGDPWHARIHALGLAERYGTLSTANVDRLRAAVGESWFEWSWALAEQKFLRRFEELTHERLGS